MTDSSLGKKDSSKEFKVLAAKPIPYLLFGINQPINPA
jgi:hypothetical protein